jgi:CheY-like chemotaxis protein
VVAILRRNPSRDFGLDPVAWSEIWETGAHLRALLDGVVRSGEAFAAQDLLFVIERHGCVEETYFDVSYDPLRVESGEVGGVYCSSPRRPGAWWASAAWPCSETSPRATPPLGRREGRPRARHRLSPARRARLRRPGGRRSSSTSCRTRSSSPTKELVKLHGGTVSVESTEARGSTFSVSIRAGKAHLRLEHIDSRPVLASTGPGAGAYVQEALGWLAGGETSPSGFARTDGARIVWADDNADVRDHVRGLLAELYDVESVADGEAALAAARRHKPET